MYYNGRSQEASGVDIASALTSCMNLGKLLKFSEPQLFYLQKWGGRRIVFISEKLN